jgi:hypothetical integral membrane protein (TIGR02206 family)
MIFLDFFSPDGVPVGVFSLTHLLVLIVCLFLIILCLFLIRNLNDNQINFMIKIIALTVLILEIIKIIWNLRNGRKNLNTFVPLYFCSLFIYSSLLGGFGKGIVREAGYGFMFHGGLIGGLSFLVYPITSLKYFPMWHFISFHSMLYHSLMVFVSLVLLFRNYRINKVGIRGFFVITFGFSLLAYLVNQIDGSSNLMFLEKPVASLNLLWYVYDLSPKVYPFIFSILQNFGCFLVSFFIYKLFSKKKITIHNL